MDLERVAGLLKVAVKPNCLHNCLLVVAPVSSYRVHAMCQTPHQPSFLSLTLMMRTAIRYLEMVAVLLSRTGMTANSFMMQ
jgi:hypothetical protein